MLRINNKYFPEICGQILMVAQIVDQLTDRHMFRHRDQLALHDPACGFVRVRKCVFDCGTVFWVEFGEDGLLVLLLHVLDNRDGVISVELSGEVGDKCGWQRIDNILADIIVDFGQHLGAHQVAKCQRQFTALVARGQFEKIGDVGFMERLDQAVRFGQIVFFDRIEHSVDKVAGEAIVFVERLYNVVSDKVGIGNFACHMRPFPGVAVIVAPPRRTTSKSNDFGFLKSAA